ncbi:MAG: hypothetical protein ACI9G6_002802, partial [Limisphaerales bacterium]
SQRSKGAEQEAWFIYFTSLINVADVRCYKNADLSSLSYA